MNNDIKAKVLMKICQLPKRKRLPLLKGFNSLFDYYINNMNVKRAIEPSILKKVSDLPLQSIKYILNLVLEEIGNFDLEFDPELKNKNFLNIRGHTTERERSIKWQTSQKEKDPYFDLKKRIYKFCYKGGKKTKISIEDFLEKFEKNPVCYISGSPIDLKDLNSFTLDHIIPTCQGGSSDLSNMGICTRMANLCKSGYTMDEFLSFCQQVLDYNKDKTQTYKKMT